MTKTQNLITLRECARRFTDAWEEHAADFPAFVEAATPACRALLERPDLLTLGFPIGTHRTPARLLYADVELSIVIGHEPANVTIPVHDHGMWEMLGLYRGRLEHRMYERDDDDSRPGHADLREVDSRQMEVGDVVCVPPPPHDLHGFTPQTDATFLVAILPGWYADVRRYFDVEAGTYYLQERTPV
jgi:hypothetical protein